MKGRILTSLLAAVAIASLQAQTISSTPKLVVGITIDQFRTDYMEAFSALYGEKGFKRLLKEGRVYTNAGYPFKPVDRSSAVATLYAGATPYYNGIIANEWLNRDNLRVTASTDDKEFMGMYTAENTSPHKLVVSTIADELKMATQGRALVYAISPFRDAAVFGAGHAGDGAFWLNDDTGKWAGSTFYGSFPTWVIGYNDRQAVDTRINNLTWETLQNKLLYTYFSPEQTRGFKHSFTDYTKYRQFKTSGLVNEEVNRLVERCLQSTTIGMDDVPDLLSITYYAGNYEHKSTTEYPVEIQDTYVRLDQQLERLIDLVDKKVGLHNTLFFITSTGYNDPETADLTPYRIPTGDFHMDRCTALLNMYLMATYGQGKYIDAYHGLDIYFNRKLIEQKQLNLPQVLSKSAEFLVQVSGVKAAYTAHELILNANTPERLLLHNGYNIQASGDIVLELNPGWKQISEDPLTDSHYTSEALINFPIIFFGYSIKPSILPIPATVDCIAPTVTHFMRIRAPNACRSTMLSGIR